GAAIRPPISPVAVSVTIFAFASFEIFSVRRLALIAEFFEGVSGGPERVRCGPQRLDEAALDTALAHCHPQRRRSGSGKSDLMRSHFREVWTSTLSRLGRSRRFGPGETT